MSLIILQAAFKLMRVPAEAAVITECKRIGLAGKTSKLSQPDVDLLVLLGTCSTPNQGISAEFCNAVANACLQDGNKASLGEPAIKAVVAGMVFHPKHVTLQTNGCRALWNLNCLPGNNKKSVAAGAVSAIKGAWNGGVRYEAVGAFAKVASADSIQSILSPGGGWLDAILTFMDNQQSDANNQFACCMALAKFSKFPFGKAAVKTDARSSYYLQRARATHTGHENVQYYSKLALQRLDYL